MVLQVVKGKVEDVELPEKADILISEPMGKLRFYKHLRQCYIFYSILALVIQAEQVCHLLI